MANLDNLLFFLGRWHPLVVHLPIGILILAWVFALLTRRNSYGGLLPAVAVSLCFGAVSAIMAVLSGYLLSRGGGYDEVTLAFHQWLGVATAVVSTGCWLLYRPHEGDGWLAAVRRFRFAALTGMLVLLTITGHYGGLLTHGEGYLSGGADPSPVVITDIQQAPVYDAVIQPIFQQRCLSCHGSRKQEGELALHTFDRLMQGGEHGPSVVPGDAAASELYRRLVLPEGHEERMPPKGRKPITHDQICLIAWWINAGAPPDRKVADLPQPDSIQPILLSLQTGGRGIEPSPLDSLPDLSPPDPVLVEQLTAKGIKVIPVASGKHQVIISAVNYPAFDDEDARLVATLGERVWQLKLGRTRITDSAMIHLGTLSGLRQLHLEHTAVGNAGLPHLRGCRQLRYLSLVGTQVTDEGLALLAGLPALEKVYVYHTAVTATGVDQLKAANARLTVDTGRYQLPALPTDSVVY